MADEKSAGAPRPVAEIIASTLSHVGIVDLGKLGAHCAALQVTKIRIERIESVGLWTIEAETVGGYRWCPTPASTLSGALEALRDALARHVGVDR